MTIQLISNQIHFCIHHSRFNIWSLLFLIFCFATTICEVYHVDYVDNTAAIFGSAKPSGILAALADFNVDRSTDVFLISPDGKSVVVYFQKNNQTLITIEGDDRIVGLIPADYNGDTVMDYLVLTTTSLSTYQGQVYYGYANRMNGVNNKSYKLGTFTDFPMLLDWDADRIADVYGELSNGTRMVFLGTSYSNFTKYSIPNMIPLNQPSFPAFVDMNNDRQADLFVTAKSNNNNAKFQYIIRNSTNQFDHKSVNDITLPPSIELFGQPIFFDLYRTGQMQMLLPTCNDSECQQSNIYVYMQNNVWSPLNISFQIGNAVWGFIPESMNELKNLIIRAPITVHVADADLNTYPDLLLHLKLNSNYITVLALNQGSGQFVLQNISAASAPGKVTHGAFFDFDETGDLGVILGYVHNGRPFIQALQHKLTTALSGYGSSASSPGDGDGYFLKVMVLQGLCLKDVDCSVLPFGLPVPGPITSYSTESADMDGGRQESIAGQVTQTSYQSLQLPFTIYGLGQFSNYIEQLIVYEPTPSGSSREMTKKMFTFIVPKTQLVIIPEPLLDSTSWTTKLFLRPFYNLKVLYVAVALIGCMIVVALIAGLLQWKERREDFEEKLQESQKFHFDAM